jgi:hypothetical protein
MPAVALGCCCGEPGPGGGTLTLCVFSCCGEDAHTVTVTGPGGYTATEGLYLTANPEALVHNSYIPACVSFTLGGAGTYQIHITSANSECTEVYASFEYSGTGDVDFSDSYFALGVEEGHVCVGCCGDEPLPTALLVDGGSFACELEYGFHNGPGQPGFWKGDTNVDAGPSACAETVPIEVSLFFSGGNDDPCKMTLLVTFPVYIQWDGEGQAYLEGGVGPVLWGVSWEVDLPDSPCSPFDLTFSRPAETCVDASVGYGIPDGMVYLTSTCISPVGAPPIDTNLLHVCQLANGLWPVNVYEA